MKKNVAIVVIISFLIGFTLTSISSVALFDADDLNISNTGEVTAVADGQESAFENIVSKYKNLLHFTSGTIAIITGICFIFNLIKYDLKNEKRKHITKLLCLAFVTIVFTLINILTNTFYY